MCECDDGDLINHVLTVLLECNKANKIFIILLQVLSANESGDDDEDQEEDLDDYYAEEDMDVERDTEPVKLDR